MSKGHIFLAQNSSSDYVRQAYALALSIKKFNRINNKTCLVTNDQVPELYRAAFDYIVPIPWSDLASNSEWKVENRWKLIHATPFKENIVYDTDMVLLNSNDHWWKFFKDKDLVFTTKVFDYRSRIITDNFYRKTFVENSLKNVYTGCYYFKKSNRSYEFFKWLDVITSNWKDFYNKLKSPQKFTSLDINAALAIKFMGAEEDTCIAAGILPSFIHMKPHIQDWKNIPSKWTDVLSVRSTADFNLYINNIKQQGLFHYVEDEFLTDEIIFNLK